MTWQKPGTFGILNSILCDNRTEFLKPVNWDEQDPYPQGPHNSCSVLNICHYFTSLETVDDGPVEETDIKNRFARHNEYFLL